MSLRTPPLRDVHAARDASFTDFGGWEMPVEFDSIREEHEAVRESAGIFDVSHMGEVVVTGPDAGRLTNRLTTNDVADLDVGDSQYAAITDDEGVMLDDTVVYRQGEDRYLVVPNAGHDADATERWINHRDRWDIEAEVENRTDDFAMFALQGPDAQDHLVEAAGNEVRDLDRFEATYMDVAGVESWVARTGYTGEDGFEMILPREEAETVWSAFDVQPCGLGARDTLRLEAGLLLSGQDFHPEDQPRTPYEAGIGFVVKLDTEFVGRDVLEAQKEQGVEEKLVGLRLIDRGIPRHGYGVTDREGEEIGVVTSGTMSPTLGYPIAFAYVPVEYAEEGTTLRVVVRGEAKKARVVNKRFLSDG